MKTQGFDAVLTLAGNVRVPPAEAVFVIQGQKIPGCIHVYETPAGTRPERVFIRASLRRSLPLKWKDAFEVLDTRKLESVGRGVVLNPLASERTRPPRKPDADFLRALAGGEKAMVEALCRDKGFAGLREREIQEFAGLGTVRHLRLAQKLEEEGKVKILRFSPLFLISEESFSFLLEQVVRVLQQYQERHPGHKGAPLDRLQKRFGLSGLVFRLALKALERSGQARRDGQRLVFPSHDVRLSAEEERILAALEAMCFKGELRALSLKDIRERFRLSPERLEKLLAVLMEREKIFQGAEGLYIHAHWLEQIIDKLRSLRKKEMTVGEFKAITGLSRKYAIPLLELLDQMGVTRRKGPDREIL